MLRFAAPRLTGTSLSVFILISLLHAVFMIGVAWFVNKSARNPQPLNAGNKPIGPFLFLSGVFFVVAFGMGAPPRDANEWIANGTHEVWRGIFLVLALLCTVSGLYLFGQLIGSNLSKSFGIIFLILTFSGAVLTAYDFYWGIFIIPMDIDNWSKEGKDLTQFFSQYDLKNGIRGSARCMFYLVSVLTFFAGWKLHIIKTWVAVILSLLSIFLLQDVFIPMVIDISSLGTHIGMVPAVALSPLYLLGVYWLAAYKTFFAIGRLSFFVP